ncbi:uncharacterized protein LOC135150453 [Daucus carota subsp. sativus]|uniref:uncharacterized protein LOC135150453 n=1 Tax=Daucus carota subsp. sativus TaxID=79200 RepID=UPI00308289CD
MCISTSTNYREALTSGGYKSGLGWLEQWAGSQELVKTCRNCLKSPDIFQKLLRISRSVHIFDSDGGDGGGDGGGEGGDGGRMIVAERNNGGGDGGDGYGGGGQHRGGDGYGGGDDGGGGSGGCRRGLVKMEVGLVKWRWR